MKLEGIDYSDKNNAVILTVDGEDFLVNYDLYKDLGLDIDQEVDFEVYKKIIADSDYISCREFALKKISYSQKSSFDLEKLLRKEDFSDISIERTLDFLDDYGLIDDLAYAKSFASDKHSLSRWSKKKISYNLASKGINQEIIDEAIGQISDEDEYENVLYFANKKVKGDLSRENRQKVFRHLANKGFDFDLINEAMEEVFS